MSDRGSYEPAQPPTSSSAHIDQVCDEFEKACRAGKPPLIEDVLMRAPAAERDRLLGELLEIELDCRQRTGTFLQAEEYRIRFPDCPELVDSVFRRVVKTRRLADYELLEELGRGGMGVVYKARQVYLNQVAAVKILPHHYLDDAQAVSRFRREMQSIGALIHPNIVRAYSAGEAGGVHYLAMEFVDGVNLHRFVGIGPPQGGPMGVGAACEILRQAALGLQHAHEHQLVHRDIKPANLMLAREGQAKILDMGLAKFHLETHGDGAAQDGLTQPGVTMGTIDYMAPEQWENSAAADIRADIYSLGCTLFFLLTGRPPYGEPDYETGRKKLMAHAVAPIPSLIENCDEAPEELDEIFRTMLAKNASDRYATPAEVAEVLAEFADPEELAEVVAALPAAEVCTAAANTGVMGRDADTPRRHDPATAGSHPRRSQNRWTRRQKFRRNVTIGVAAGATAALCIVLAWFDMRWHHGATRANVPNAAGRDDAPASRASLAYEVALLPGLNGRWWFEEVPWFTPFARQALADKVLAAPDLKSALGDHPQGCLNTNTSEAYGWLWEAVQRCRSDMSPCQQKLLDRLHDQPRGGESLEDALRQFIDGHEGRAWTADDLYTRALLQQKIAELNGDNEKSKATASEAKRSYESALDAYAAQPKNRISTQALCLLDSALFCEHYLADFKEAKQRIDEALAEKDLPAPFHVYVLVERGRLAGVMATSPGEYEDHRFVYAKKLLDGDTAIKANHPLAAYIAESYAASLLDQWKVEEASKQFQAAYHVRLFDKEEKDPAATIFVFRDRQGSAVTNRYRGNLGSARRSFKSLVDEIQAALDDAQRRGPVVRTSDLDALRGQLASAREAWADCELYGGAASDGRVNLSQAADNYDQARKLSPDASGAIALGCKLAIVRALSGKEKPAADIMAEPQANGNSASGADPQRAALLRQLAEGVLALKGQTPAEGRKLLRSFLDQFKLNPVSRGPHRREIVEMQLFAAELLLASDLESEPKSARRDLRYLDGLLAIFRGRRDMRPYLRRYYELAVRACGKADLIQIAQYLLDSRTIDRHADSASKATLVLFSFTPKENFAIFLPQDGRPGKRFDLDITRDQIKSSNGKTLHLDDELAKLLAGEIAAGRPMEVFWSDAATRPSEDPDALAAGDWPFDIHVDLK